MYKLEKTQNHCSYWTHSLWGSWRLHCFSRKKASFPLSHLIYSTKQANVSSEWGKQRMRSYLDTVICRRWRFPWAGCRKTTRPTWWWSGCSWQLPAPSIWSGNVRLHEPRIHLPVKIMQQFNVEIYFQIKMSAQLLINYFREFFWK